MISIAFLNPHFQENAAWQGLLIPCCDKVDAQLFLKVQPPRLFYKMCLVCDIDRLEVLLLNKGQQFSVC